MEWHRQRVDEFRNFARIELPPQEIEDALCYAKGVAGKHGWQLGRDMCQEFLWLAIIAWTFGNAPAVIIDASDEHRQLRTKVHCLFGCQPVAQRMKDRAQGTVGIVPSPEEIFFIKALKPGICQLDCVIKCRHLGLIHRHHVPGGFNEAKGVHRTQSAVLISLN